MPTDVLDPLGIESATRDNDPLGIGAGDKSDPLGLDKSKAAPLKGFVRGWTTGAGDLAKGVGLATTLAPAWDPESAGLDTENAAETQRRAARTPSQTVREIQANPLYQAGQTAVEGAPHLTPAEAKSKISGVAEMAGGFMPLVAAGPAGPAVIGLQSAGEHISADYDQAKAEGLDDDTAAQRALNRATASGTLQAGIFFALPKPVRAVAEKYLVEKLGQAGFARWLTGRVSAAGEGALLGGASQAAENVVENKPVTEGVGAAGAGLAGANLLMPWLKERNPLELTPAEQVEVEARLQKARAAQQQRPGEEGPPEGGTPNGPPPGSPPPPKPAGPINLADLEDSLKRNQIAQNRVLQEVQKLTNPPEPAKAGTPNEAEIPPPTNQPGVENARPKSNASDVLQGSAEKSAETQKPAETPEDLQAQLQAEMEGQTEKPAEPGSDAAKQSVQSESSEPAPTVTETAPPVKRRAPGLRARKIFDRETELNGPDILSWIADEMPLLSRTQAKKRWGAEKYNLNKAEWDGAPPLERPHHNVIYHEGGSPPDQVAQTAYDERLIDEANVNDLWTAIEKASKARARAYEQQRRHEKILQEEIAQHKAFTQAKATGDIQLDAEELRPGDTMRLAGEDIKVVDRDEQTGDVTIEDGTKFGRQRIASGDTIYVEKIGDELVDRLQETPPAYRVKEEPGRPDLWHVPDDELQTRISEAEKQGNRRELEGLENEARQRGLIDKTTADEEDEIQHEQNRPPNAYPTAPKEPGEIQGRQQRGDVAGRHAGGDGEHAGERSNAERTASSLQPASTEAPPQTRVAAQIRELEAEHARYSEIWRYAAKRHPDGLQQPYPASSRALNAFSQMRYIDGQIDLLEASPPKTKPTVETIAAHIRELEAEHARYGEIWRYAAKSHPDGLQQPYPASSRALNAFSQMRYLDGQIDHLQSEHDRLQRSEAPGQKDLFEDWLERAIEATDPLKGSRSLEGVTGAPVWLTKTAANGALRVLLQAYKGGKKLLGAINEAVRWLEDQKIKGFNQADAQDWLLKEAKRLGVRGYGESQSPRLPNIGDTVEFEAGFPAATVRGEVVALANNPVPGAEPKIPVVQTAGGTKWPASEWFDSGRVIRASEETVPAPAPPTPTPETTLPAAGVLAPHERLSKRAQEVAARLGEINQQISRGGITPQLRSERYQLAKEGREVQRSLAKDPEYVADLLRKMDAAGKDLERSRDAGNGLGVREAGERFQDLSEQLQMVKPDLMHEIYNDLVSKGEIAGNQNGELPAGRTLGELTRWLQQHKLDSPKMPLRERFNLARRLADDWASAKDKLAQAGDRVAAMWQAFKAQYKSPPTDTEFRNLVKDWFFLKQWTGLESHRWVHEIRAQMPDPTRRAALSVWMDADGDHELLRAQASEVPEQFRRVWETAQNLTTKEQALGRRIERDFEQKLEDARNLGLLDKGLEHYGVPQIWRVLPKHEGEFDPFADKTKPRNPTAKLDPRAPFFSLERTHPTYFDGIMAGGVPKSLDVGALVGVYNEQFHNSLADRGFIKALREVKASDGMPGVMIAGGVQIKPTEGGRTYFFDSNRRPAEAVTKDGRPYRSVDHWALKGWKFASQTEGGNPIFQAGDFLVHPEFHAFLKNELSQSALQRKNAQGEYEHPYLHAAVSSAAFLKASKFASATFHLVTIGEHAIFHGILPLTSGVELDPARNVKLAALMRHGMDLGFGSQRDLFEEGVSSHGGIWGRVPGLGDALTKMSDFLFKDYIPKIKAKTGLVVLERNMQRYGKKLSPDQIAELTASQMNAAYGIQNWRLMGSNKTMLDINRLLFTAPDFLLSRAKVAAQALKPYNREQRYFLLAQAGFVYMAARALNYLFDDDFHWEPENALSVVYKGRAYSARFIVNDIWHLASDQMSFWQGRLGALGRSGIEATTQRDMRSGARIDVPFETESKTWRAAQILVKDMAMWLVPMGAEGALPGAAGREQTGPGQVGLAFVGIGSHKYTPETKMWDAAQTFNRQNPDPHAQLYQRKRDAEARTESAYRKLDNLLDAGEMDRARKEYEALLAEGYNERSLVQHFKPSRPFTGSEAREQAFRNSLPAAQREMYQRAIADRQERLIKFQRLLASSPALRGFDWSGAAAAP